MDWNECRRIKLSMMLDGPQMTCYNLPNCHRCDFCCDPQLPLMDTLRAIMLDPLPPPLLPATAQGSGEIAAIEKGFFPCQRRAGCTPHSKHHLHGVIILPEPPWLVATSERGVKVQTQFQTQTCLCPQPRGCALTS